MGHTFISRLENGSDESETSVERLARALHQLEAGQRRLRVEYAAMLKLTNSEFNALTTIGHAGEVTPKELSRTLHMTTGAVTAMLDRLENAGLVTRVRHPRDRRSVLIEPTYAGHEALDWLFRKYQDAIEKIAASEAKFLEPAFAQLLNSAAQSMTQEAHSLEQDATDP